MSIVRLQDISGRTDKLTKQQLLIGDQILKEIKARIQFPD